MSAVTPLRSAHPLKRTRSAGGAAAARSTPLSAEDEKPTAAVSASGRPIDLLSHLGLGKVIVDKPKGNRIYSEGDAADCIYYIRKGRVKVSTVSRTGKEGIVAVLEPADFLGEECIASCHPVRLTSATALNDCVLLKISKGKLVAALRRNDALSDAFVSFLLERNARMQADLVDLLFNSSEKRLARVLLLLAHFGKKDRPEKVIPRITQEDLAEIVGTTRSRVSFFMNRFRKLGFIKYNGEIRIHHSLLNMILRD